jgi:hypothetical protein
VELLCNFYFGTGKFNGENFICQNIKIFQRGTNDMILKPIQSISGKILKTGNVILKNNPPIIDVQQLFSGQLILNYSITNRNMNHCQKKFLLMEQFNYTSKSYSSEKVTFGKWNQSILR